MKLYGMHLTIDLIGCKTLKLGELDFIYKVLAKLPAIINMRPITNPYVVPYINKENILDNGVTGFVILAESHISIHTYTNREYVFIDVFSCNKFDRKKTESYLNDVFRPKKMVHSVVKRGKYFHRGV